MERGPCFPLRAAAGLRLSRVETAHSVAWLSLSAASSLPAPGIRHLVSKTLDSQVIPQGSLGPNIPAGP